MTLTFLKLFTDDFWQSDTPDARAKRLFFSLLSTREQRQFMLKGYVTVRGNRSGYTYQIHRNGELNHCVSYDGNSVIPHYDRLAQRYLTLKYREQYFLRGE